ncbi:hypothetical protein [Emticicia sp. C21]|uniref:hypothetical protein n=1 Tax=Emticicia sp. C21 TaxID=2302915 RepID=UPI000E353594|nr:hypothetical protein [Emticicia sp. C21]RFS16802.1 hypothetical protein D0T08_08970 [Emticicia sp. C21]
MLFIDNHEKLLFLFSFVVPLSGFAQSSTILPSAVGIPKVASLPVCNTNEKGKQIFHNTNNKMYYCNGVNWQEMTGGGFTLPYRDSTNTQQTLLHLENRNNKAIIGESYTDTGVYGRSYSGTGVAGISDEFFGGYFRTNSNYPALKVENYVYAGWAAQFIGNVTVSDNFDVNGSADIGEELTVDGKGVVTSNTDKQQKLVRMTDTYSATSLAAGAYKDMTLDYENFGALPTVTVGQIMNGVSTGDWYKVLAIPINVTANSCQIRLYNTSGAAITFNATWHFVIIGVK